MDCETVFETLRELVANGEFRAEALEFLHDEIVVEYAAHIRARRTCELCLRNVLDDPREVRHRKLALIERLLMRNLDYRDYVLQKITAQLCHGFPSAA